VVEKAKELNIKLAPMIFNRVRLPVVSMTLSTPVLIQPEVTFVACVGGTASKKLNTHQVTA
jgi:hypothetical protein